MMMLVGGTKPSIISFTFAVFFFFLKHRQARVGGCTSLPEGNSDESHNRLIHYVKGLESLLLLIHQNAQKFKFYCLWLTKFNLHVFNEVRIETCTPLGNC